MRQHCHWSSTMILVWIYLLSSWSDYDSSGPLLVTANHYRRTDCYISGIDNTECHNWGRCVMTLSTYNQTLALISDRGQFLATHRTRWHCECHSQRYESNGTSSNLIQRPTCQYGMYTVPGISQWSIPWWLANGVLCASIVAAALATLTRMYRIDKLRRNLSSLALICICASFLQLTLGQFLLASRGDGSYVQAPNPEPVDGARLNTTTETIVTWFVFTVSGVGVLTAYHAMYFYFVRLAMPVMPRLSPLGAIGTPRQVRMMLGAMTLMIVAAPLSLIDDLYADLHFALYVLWKGIFGILFGIAGLRARRTLARILPQSSTPIAPADTISTNNTDNAGNMNGIPTVHLSHTPLGTVMPVTPSSGMNHKFGVRIPSSPQLITVQPAALSDIPSSARNNSDALVLPITIDDQSRRHLLRNTTMLSLLGSLISILQAILFLLTWIQTSNGISAHRRVLMTMCAVPLSCLWASFLIFTFWIPKRMLPKDEPSQTSS